MQCTYISDDSIVEAIGMGSTIMQVMLKRQNKKIQIKDVFHMPKLHVNLLLVNKLLSSGCNVQFNMNECIVRAFDEEVIAMALYEGNLYQIIFFKVHEVDVANLVQPLTKDGALKL